MFFTVYFGDGTVVRNDDVFSVEWLAELALQEIESNAISLDHICWA